jgi:chain length determinant protein EpsF
VIRVSYTSADRSLSAQIANAFAQAYVATMLELRVGPTRQAAAWFDEQLKSLRASLEGAQTKLSEYQREKGIVSADERLDVENSRLAELSAQAVRSQDQTLDFRSRGLQASDYLKRGATLEELPEVLANPQIQKLRADLLQSEVRLQELSSQYGPNYPQYQRVQAENRSLRAKIDAEMKMVLAGIETSAHQSAWREAELNSAIAAQRSRLLERKTDRNELMVLTRDVESAQRAYDIALQRAVTSQVESRASQPDVTVLDPATPPVKPYRPRIALNIALAGIVGTMLGAGLVTLMEMLERRVRRREDLEIALNTPILGVLQTWRPPKNRLAVGDISRALPRPR